MTKADQLHQLHQALIAIRTSLHNDDSLTRKEVLALMACAYRLVVEASGLMLQIRIEAAKGDKGECFESELVQTDDSMFEITSVRLKLE